MAFAQRRNHQKTRISERIPVIKRRMTVYTYAEMLKKKTPLNNP